MNSRRMRSPMATRRAAMTGWQGSMGTKLMDGGVSESGEKLTASRWVTRVMGGRDSMARSVSYLKEGGRGTARQSYLSASMMRRISTAKSPEPWITGMAVMRGENLKRSWGMGEFE